MALLSGTAPSHRMGAANMTPEQFLVPSEHTQRLASASTQVVAFCTKKFEVLNTSASARNGNAHKKRPSCAAGPDQTHRAKADTATEAVVAFATLQAHIDSGWLRCPALSRAGPRVRRMHAATGQTHRWVSRVVALVALHRLVVGTYRGGRGAALGQVDSAAEAPRARQIHA